MPDTTGHAPGDTWTGTTLDERPVKYTIPEGNGGNTVDLEIQNPNGTVDRWRIVRNELGGLKHWHDDADGNSSYAERPTADGDWYFQSFRPGTSTSGAPSREFTAEADLSRIYTPSYGADGDYLGTDVGVLNGRGLYDNQHVDQYQNTTFTRTVPNDAGGLDSVLVGQVDNTGHGWWADELDRRWDVYVDDNGNPARRRYDPVTQQRSFVYQDGNNTKNETIDSSGRIVNSLTFGPGNELLSSLSRDSGLLIEGKPGKNGELEYTFRDERDRRRGRLTYLPNGGMRLYYDGYEVVEYDGSGQEVKRYNRMGDRSVQAWLGEEATSAFLRAAGGAAEGIGGLTGINSYINMAGQVLGYNPRLATRDEVLTGLEQGLRSFHHATRYFHLVSARELTMYRTGNQGLAETLANIRPSFLAAANEESKLLIGTDWTGISDSPGAVLGNATFGIVSWFVPTRVPRIPKAVVGRGTDVFTPTPPTALTTRWSEEFVFHSDLMSPRNPGATARTSRTRPTEPTTLTNLSGRTPAWVPSFAVNGFEALRRAPRQVWAGIEQMGASVVVAARQTWEVLSNPHGELVTPEGIRVHSSSLGSGGRPWSPRPYQPALEPGRATKSIRQIRNIRDRVQRWTQGEVNARERTGGGPERAYKVPKNSDKNFPIEQDTVRKVDVPIDLPDGGVIALEVKMYQRYRRVEVAPGQWVTREFEVPLSDHIKNQIAKDVALRKADPGFRPLWEFMWAGPSPELRAELIRADITFVWHL
ncbi:hypothetical protein IU459_01940 [Nocardia amamiensis]|uniref:RHS repeat-associated core domain-containing protein n=1 Tax=Nocardia amamiensis TaxID=404578 RepID=A0ABS0CI70_9NOCA|nr:hypothetical protein [Nocardia amamiensis]MBF6296302.1 hypothetical protein [Nocardia amamiensis]